MPTPAPPKICPHCHLVRPLVDKTRCSNCHQRFDAPRELKKPTEADLTHYQRWFANQETKEQRIQ